MHQRELEVIVVDDHAVMRRGIEQLLRRHGLRVAGSAGDLAAARSLIARRRYDVILLDVQLGSSSSLGLLEDLLREDPEAPVVLYTGIAWADPALREAVDAGARGFVLKSSPPQQLVAALRAVAAGGTHVDPTMAAAIAEGGGSGPRDVLSERELQVLELLADGLNGQMIAERLHLSPETVRTHVRNATSKLGARTRVQAVAMVVGRRPPA